MPSARLPVKSGSGGGGRIDILVTNAGQGRVSTFESTTDNEWREEFELKLFSQILPIRTFRHLLKQSDAPAIVAVNSLLSLQPEPHMVCTAAARAGVQNLLKSLATEFAPQIRVNTILLGLVDSAQWQRRYEAREDLSQSREKWFANQARQKHIPLGTTWQSGRSGTCHCFPQLARGELCHRRQSGSLGRRVSIHLRFGSEFMSISIPQERVTLLKSEGHSQEKVGDAIARVLAEMGRYDGIWRDLDSPTCRSSMRSPDRSESGSFRHAARLAR